MSARDPAVWRRSTLPEVDQATMLQARKLVRENALSGLETGNVLDQPTLSAQVDENGERHRVFVMMEPGGALSCDCSCPAGPVCAHIVAGILAAGQRSSGTQQPASKPLDAESPKGEAAIPAVAAGRDGDPELRFLLTHARNASVVICPHRFGPRPKQSFGMREDGGYSSTPFAPSRVREAHIPAWLGPDDVELLRALDECAGWHEAFCGSLLDCNRCGDVIGRVLQTGRCHVFTVQSPALSRGPSLSFGLEWQLLPNGAQRFAPCIDEHDERVWLETTPPHVLDLERRVWHPVRFAAAGQQALDWLARPDLAPEAVESALGELDLHDPQGRLPRPRRLRRSRETAQTPEPTLVLAALADRPCKSDDDDDNDAAAADLQFRYGDTAVAWDLVGPSLLRGLDEVVEIQRDPEREQACLAALKACGLKPREAPPPHPADPVHRVLAVHSNRRERVGRLWVADPGGPACDDPVLVWTGLSSGLRAAEPGLDWRIDERPDFPFQVIRPQQWYSRVDPRAGSRGQVSLDFGCVLDGHPISLLPALVRRLADMPGEWLHQLARESGCATDPELLVRIDRQRLVALPGDRLAELAGLIRDHARDTPIVDRLVLSRARLGDVEQVGRGWKMQAGDELALLAARLSGTSPIAPVATPIGLRATLRPYQATGLSWLQFLSENDFAGVLADDMGLGKTIQTLAHILLEKQAGRLDHPVLIVAPTSLLFNWRAEARRFAPDLNLLVLQGPRRRREFHRLPGQDIVLTSYALVTRDIGLLERHSFHTVLLDEAQYIKNPRARISQAVRRIDARHRLALSGTPIENHLGELWALFDFLMPGLLGDARDFRRYFRDPIERDQDTDRSAELGRRIRPFLMRRTKAEVAPELPDKIEIVHTAEMSEPQRTLYDRVRGELHGRVSQAIETRGLARSRIVVLDALLRLRQICCDPRLMRDLQPEDWSGHSAKLELLMEILPELLAEGRRVLLFSQFTGMLSLVEAELQKCGLDWVKLTGRTRDRQTPVRRFQQREVALFLVSLKAGGVGLNLTAADTIIHYDPWWNPATEDQATDRAHRIGQDKTVMVYRLYTEDTVEQKIRLMQQKKRELVQDLLAGGGAARLSAEDLAFLFGSDRD